MLHMIKRLWKDDSAQGLVEYGLIIGLVAVVVIGALVALRGGLQNIFASITAALDDPGSAGTNP